MLHFRDDELEATEENAVIEIGKLKRKKPTTQCQEKNEVPKSSVQKSLGKIEVPKAQQKQKKSFGAVKEDHIGKDHILQKKDEKHDSSSTRYYELFIFIIISHFVSLSLSI